MLVSSVSMDSVHLISSPNVCVVTNDGNLWPRKHSNNNIFYARKQLATYALKVSQHIRKTQIDYKFLRFQQPKLNHHNKCIGGGSTYQECNEKYVVKGTTTPYFDHELDDASYPKNISNYAKQFLDALILFSSPYAMTTQVLSLISASLLAVQKLSDVSPLLLIGLLQVVVPSLVMGIYIAGLNQLCDLEIDKINKPYLPLASGKISSTVGAIIVASSLALSFWLGWIIGSWPLIWALLLSCLLWTGYSINAPLLRWKGNPILAAIVISLTWAFVFPILSFLHIQTFVFKRPIIFPRSLISVAAFGSFYFIGLAMCKDIPDVEGDTAFGIYSFAARLGKERVFWICLALFEMAFGVVFLTGVSSPFLWIRIVTGLGHVVLASVLWYRAKSTNLKSKDSIASFYMFIWKLLSVEYLLMPLLR